MSNTVKYVYYLPVSLEPGDVRITKTLQDFKSNYLKQFEDEAIVVVPSFVGREGIECLPFQIN
jgi:hypothetical protein